jgi:copper chaperone
MKTIKVKGMSCQHCVMSVTKALSAIDGIKDVQVDLKKGQASFTETKSVDSAIIAQAVKKAGFEIG